MTTPGIASTIAPQVGRLVLGTAAFGQPYGITNRNGEVDAGQAAAIVAVAKQAGVAMLDTAANYGGAEKILGLIADTASMAVITKLSGCAGPRIGEQEVALALEAFDRSLLCLNRPSVHGLLLHDVGDLMKPGIDRLLGELQGLRESGKVEKIGVSVYQSSDIDLAYELFEPDIVQIPFNIFDRRLATSGYLDHIVQSGGEVYVRSVFLQGLLLSGGVGRPSWTRPWQSSFDQFESACARFNLTALQACLGFVMSHEQVSHVVVGATSVEEFGEILAALENTSVGLAELQEFIPASSILLDPRQWPT
jgi:aryl-alcohol dehydrogenase-like predicted oxidoreductase